MRVTLKVIRWVVGLLFIFSGLVKANDPLGLSYKMQEFFEVWGLSSLNDYTLALSLLMNVFEVLAGVAVIVGWRMKLFSWLLLLLIIFFSFLTGYAVLSGKIKTCGCFGDCLPLTPLQSFIKDLVLLLLIVVLFVNRKIIKPGFSSTAIAPAILIITVVGVSFLQGYVLKYLPVVDCLPYRKGNDLVAQMQVPAGAVADSFAITYKYNHNGKNVEFDANSFPDDFDSTYEYVDRYDKLVRQGNATPAISDFSLKSLSGVDTTEAILSKDENYLMVFAKDFKDYQHWKNNEFNELLNKCKQDNIPVFIVTADLISATHIFKDAANITVLSCDYTVIKTAARVNPTFFVMKKAKILEKVSYNNTDKLIRNIDKYHN